MADSSYEFDYPVNNEPSIIKVIGVGGGGSNAVNHMYRQGIRGVEFFVCNTDKQALETSPVPNKIQIGTQLTEGLGAGANPGVGEAAAHESREQLRQILSKSTKMLFITAGMGGGTGTGAAPVIAELARGLDILTVGIVTAPFMFEGKPKMKRAERGIEELKRHCDTVLVILNNKLKEVYGKMSMKEAFNQADSVLSTAAKSIAEIITVSGNINVDFEDVKTVMKSSGAAVMGSAVTEGDDRAKKAAEGAMTSPLLNNTNIHGAKYILLSIVVGNEEDFQMEELEEITDYVQQQAGEEAEIIFGQAHDESLGNKISVTVIATGFDRSHDLFGFGRDDDEDEEKKTLDVKKPAAATLAESTNNVLEKSAAPKEAEKAPAMMQEPEAEKEEAKEEALAAKPAAPSKVVFELNGEYEIVEDDFTEEKNDKRALEQQYKSLQTKPQGSLRPTSEMSNDELKEKQEVPAYLRKGVILNNKTAPTEPNVSRYNLTDDNELLGGNKFLHDNVD